MSAVPSAPLDHVARAHTGGEQGLVGVAHRRVRYEQALLRQDPLGYRLRPSVSRRYLRPISGVTSRSAWGIARGGYSRRSASGFWTWRPAMYLRRAWPCRGNR